MKRHPFHSRKAVSNMIGAAFFVVIILTGLNLLVYNFAQNVQYEFSISSKETLAHDKLAENLQITSTKMVNCAGVICTLNITAFNSGGRPIRIVRVWVTSNATQMHQSFIVNIPIETASFQPNIGSTLGTFNSSNVYSLNLVTDRGNTFPVRYAPSTAKFLSSMGFGWITMDWNTYLYNFSSSKTDPDHGPYPAWCVNTGPNGAFLFITRVSNHWDRDVYLLPQSYLVFYQTGGSAQPFYLMSPSASAQGSLNGQGAYNPNPSDLSTYISVPANPSDQSAGGELITLKFFAGSPGGTSQPNNALGSGGSFAVFLIIFYKDSAGNVVSQTIPFESTEATSSGVC